LAEDAETDKSKIVTGEGGGKEGGGAGANLLSEVIDDGSQAKPHELINHSIAQSILETPVRCESHVGERMREAFGWIPGLREHDVLQKKRRRRGSKRTREKAKRHKAHQRNCQCLRTMDMAIGDGVGDDRLSNKGSVVRIVWIWLSAGRPSREDDITEHLHLFRKLIPFFFTQQIRKESTRALDHVLRELTGIA
jgi:hypothetical protein